MINVVVSELWLCDDDILFSTNNLLLGLTFPRVYVIHDPVMAKVARKCRPLCPTWNKSLEERVAILPSIVALKQVTRAGILQRLLAFIRLPTCALYTPQEDTDKHQFVAI